METIKTGILTVSDRCSQGLTKDQSGDNLENILNTKTYFDATVCARKCVPDNFGEIHTTLKKWCDTLQLDLILTTGGTGFSPRDVTPDATKEIIEREAPGFTFAILGGSLQATKFGMLSRLVCGIRGKTLILNLPGSRKASEECLSFVATCIPHAVDQLRNDVARVALTHKEVQKETKAMHQPHSCTHSSNVSERPRHSPYPMISVEKAQAIILQEALKLGIEKVPVQDCLGRILAQDVSAKEPHPPFPASVKDGYAVIASDGKGQRLVLSASTAGFLPNCIEVVPGSCVRISTGAPVPKGANAVVQVEDTELLSKEGVEEKMINILKEPGPGQDIRPVGSDIKKGEKVMGTWEKIGPAEIGLLATVGVNCIDVFCLPLVAVLSTGNELLDAGEPGQEGCIRDSNRPALLAFFKEHGFPTMDLGIARDSPEELLMKLRNAFKSADILVSTGGVSMGEKDLVKQVLERDFQATIHFGRVFMKPGKPTTFASLMFEGKKKLIFGLPGNPVSAMVTAQLFVLPCLKKMAGWNNPICTIIKAELEEGAHLDPRPEYHRAILEWSSVKSRFVARSTGKQASSRLLSMKNANALLLFPPSSDGKRKMEDGEIVDAIIVNHLRDYIYTRDIKLS